MTSVSTDLTTRKQTGGALNMERRGYQLYVDFTASGSVKVENLAVDIAVALEKIHGVKVLTVDFLEQTP